MSDSNTTAPASGDQGGSGTQQQPQPTTGEAAFTQADVDRIVSERIARERQKYADYDDLKATAEKADEFQGQYEELLGKQSTTEYELWRERAARKHGLDDELLEFLTGETAEELEKRAQVLADKLNAAAPAAPRTGPKPDPSQGKGSDMPLNGDPLLDSLKTKLGIP